MRLAYVCADPGVPVNGSKGASVHLRELTRALAARGARIDLFAMLFEPGPAWPGVTFHRLPEIPREDVERRERLSQAANADLAAALRAHGPYDAVYECHALWSVAAMEHARDRGIPGLLAVHAPLVEEQARWRRLLDREGAERAASRAFDLASAILAVSEGVAAPLRERRGLARRVHVVQNGADTERFRPGVPPARPAPPGTFTVGFCGSLKPWHGLGTLVEAFSLLHRRDPSRLLIVGDGPSLDEVRAHARRLGVDARLELTGAVDPDDVPGLLASMDVATAPYPPEPSYFSPLKVYECMAQGLPVVASRVGQLEALVEDGVRGLLCPPGDPLALAATLDRLAADPALRERLGRAARAHVVASHTWDAVARRVLELASGRR